MERLDDDEGCPRRRWRVIEGGGTPCGASGPAPDCGAPAGRTVAETVAPEAAARPVPEDYGLTRDDLRIWYAPGRVGALLALAATVWMAGVQAYDAGRLSDPWILGALPGLLYGAMIGGFAGLGLLVLVHWCDPLVGMAWPVYARLRRYRDALAAAVAAERSVNERMP
ncbi:hypothetical protein [Azospirillum isscasi]|uniref:Uncharacterized protein n=1 Tax=Azospirillum isscasi TaxID=3053926 RepID=A0ABU0WN34_9PROT|nr:hypothetical protein [Azospirillum isscasi]MDQ2105527.1 hypothetical protein [Azospirillum isscasi]